jgi:predicted N-acetyltransferase YhbS
MSSKFTLRELQPTDSLAITKLITDFDGDMTTRFLVNPYAAIVYGTENRTTGVVVEAKGVDRIIGMGTVRFSRVKYNGDIIPLAFLDGLKVHKDFRGNGLGYQIASWRIQKAKAELGDQCVIATGMLHDNHASHAVARKWCREFAESALDFCITPTLTKPPKQTAGTMIREIEPHEYEEFAAKQNDFYSQYNLFPPCSPASMADALDVSVEGRKPYRFFVAINTKGNLLAGAKTWARGLLKSDTINNLPSALRAMNKLAHLLPSDFTIRDVAVSGMWYEAGQIKFAQTLWETMRWACRDQGTTLATGFDSRDPVRKVVTLKPWHQPRPKITFALHGPTALDRDQLLFASGRV